jgi:SAM-dependent methyltransferase
MSNKIPDQKTVWDKKHSSGEHENLRHVPSSFAPIAENYIPKGATIVELGCGVGRESEYFARKGFRVLASDISAQAIDTDKEHFAGLNIDFSVQDMRQPLPFADSEVDVVYCNLSLHYFDDQTTRAVFEEIWRVLKSDSILAFTCKSIHDRHYGNGEEVEENVFVSKNGHVRHLFSLDYTKELLGKKFKPIVLEEVEDENDGKIDSLIRCVAKKTGEIEQL